MTHDDADEDILAPIDLRAWRVPPPAAIAGPSLVMRALSPAAAPPKRRRLGWLLAAIVLVNAVIASLIVILLARAPVPAQTVMVQPAGGSPVDAQVRDLLQRLEAEQRELEARLDEIKQLRALVTELSDKVQKFEEADARRDHTVPRPPDHPAVAHDDHPPTAPAGDASCDEVSCVLTNNGGACCAKFRKPPPPVVANGLPEALDRAAISNGIASVKASVAACSTRSTVHGIVKLRVRVSADGRVTTVSVAAAPDAALAGCVASMVQRAVFPRTQTGGSFSYPFVF
jgi:hypothetical protein